MCLGWNRQRPGIFPLIALSVVSLNAAFAAGSFLYYHFRPPSSSLPPWEDPQILTFSLFFFFAPIGMILGLIAAARGGPKWLTWLVEVASVPLFLIGLMAGAAV